MTRRPLLRAIAIALVALAAAVATLVALPALGHSPAPDAPPIGHLAPVVGLAVEVVGVPFSRPA